MGKSEDEEVAGEASQREGRRDRHVWGFFSVVWDYLGLIWFRHGSKSSLVGCEVPRTLYHQESKWPHIHLTQCNSQFAYFTEVCVHACVRLSVCTALVVLDLAQDANVHIIQMIKNKGHIQLIPVFVAVLSGFALYSTRTCVCVRVHTHVC